MKKDYWSNYIIDLTRINELTASPGDDATSTPFGPVKIYNISRTIIKEYTDIYIKSRATITTDDNKMEHIINTLVYNGILVDKATIRDEKINQIINE